MDMVLKLILSGIHLITCHKFRHFFNNCDIISLIFVVIPYLLYIDIVLYWPLKMYIVSVKDAKQLLKGDRIWLKWVTGCAS